MPFAVPDNQITKYERLVCYYALPRLLNPFTVGLLAAYLLCLVEALAALAYGLWTQQRLWTLAGAWALGGVIVLGLAAFSLRALLNDWRQRMALARAQKLPMSMDTLEAPDPFSGHSLFRRIIQGDKHSAESLFSREKQHYAVELVKAHSHWRIRNEKTGELFELTAVQAFRRLLFATRLLEVHQDTQLLATIKLQHRLRGIRCRILQNHPEQQSYMVVDGCIRCGEELVGRVYLLRGSLYMDLSTNHLNSGLLASFLVCW